MIRPWTGLCVRTGLRYDSPMVWAWTIVVALAVGLPAAAWKFSRNLKPAAPSVDGLGPPTDPVDRWLIERHCLPALQRHQVRQAVLYGRALTDPALKKAARDLAAGALGGEVEVAGRARMVGWILLVEAAAMIAAGIFILIHLASPAGLLSALLGLWSAVQGVVVLRTIHGGAERAYRLNA